MGPEQDQAYSPGTWIVVTDDNSVHRVIPRPADRNYGDVWFLQLNRRTAAPVPVWTPVRFTRLATPAEVAAHQLDQESGL